jgi:hypothetical protein
MGTAQLMAPPQVFSGRIALQPHSAACWATVSMSLL